MFYNIKIKKLKEIGKKKRKKGTPYYIYTCARNRDKEEWQWEEWDKRTDGKYKKKSKGDYFTLRGRGFLQVGEKVFAGREGKTGGKGGKKENTAKKRTTNTEKKSKKLNRKKQKGVSKSNAYFSSTDEKRITTHPPHAFISNDSISTSSDRIQSLR